MRRSGVDGDRCPVASDADDYPVNMADAGLARIAGAPRWMIIGVSALVMSLAGAIGLVRATNQGLGAVERLPAVTPVLSGASTQLENTLLVGSDSRVGSDPTDVDHDSIGTESATPGMRSDSMIVVRRDKGTGTLALLSIPRDLLVKIGDTDASKKINSAYQLGPDVLVRTVARALNIPIHHYVEVGFPGFKRIVDAVGGVRICVDRPSRDKATGYFSGRGCKVLNGSKALGYARSRHFEQKKNGRWVLDGSGDVGRGERQRAFMSALARDAAAHLAGHPLDADEVLAAFAAAVRVDERLDPVDLARKWRNLGDDGTVSYSLPVNSDMVGGVFVFRLSNAAQPVLAYFAGLGPAPDPATS